MRLVNNEGHQVILINIRVQHLPPPSTADNSLWTHEYQLELAFLHLLHNTWVSLAFSHKLGREASRRVLPPLIEHQRGEGRHTNDN